VITTGLQTGDNVRICTHVVLSGGGVSTVRMGDWSFIAYGSKIFCGSEDYSGDYGPVNEYWGSNKVYQGDVKIGDYAGIFSDVILMPGVSIPEGCYIGAQSLVRPSDVLEPWNVYSGNPLRTAFPRPRNREAVLRLARDPAFLKHPIAV
jgi:acetyltransferase-like isoleucine patch superfamily enzyme